MRPGTAAGESVANKCAPDFYAARHVTGLPWHRKTEPSVKEIDSYLVRIVRRDGDASAGVVEQVRSGKTAPFASLAELSALLAGRRRFARFRSPVAGDDATPKPSNE
jgi:hypothetical protein